MARAESEQKQREAAELRARAEQVRRVATELRLAGFRDQAARHLLDARLHDLQAVALEAATRGA